MLDPHASTLQVLGPWTHSTTLRFLEINFNWPVGLFSSKFSLSLENIVMAHSRGPTKLAIKSL